MNEINNVNKTKKSLVKSIMIGTVVIGILGSVGVFAAEIYEEKQEQRAQTALTEVIQSQAQATNVRLITTEEAKQIALNELGLTEADVTQLQVKLDREDNYMMPTSYVYTVEFMYNGLDYEFEIDGIEQTILHTDVEA